MNHRFDELLRPRLLGPALARALGDPAWTDLDADLITGGKSNLTFRLRSGAGTAILRRPPTGVLVASAHDMAREVRVQRALAGTAVPVPDVLFVDSGLLLGVPCYVMSEVTGHVVRNELPAEMVGPRIRRRIGTTFVDTLAAIHAVNVNEVGLERHGRSDEFLRRQLRRWVGQLDDGSEQPKVLSELARVLQQTVPTDRPPTLLHGDYRLDNVVLTNEGVPAAVLDWEMSTVGDPFTDLGLLLLYWREPGERPLTLTPAVTHQAGFQTRLELVNRYAETTGADPDGLQWYEAFAHFKFALIATGIANRVAAGSMAGQQFGDLAEEIIYLAESGLQKV